MQYIILFSTILRHRALQAAVAVLVLAAAASAQSFIAVNHSYTTTGSATSPPTLSDPAPGLLAGVLYDDEGFSLSDVRFRSNTWPAHGSLYVDYFGAMTYTPNAGFFGTDTFNYWLSATDYNFVTHYSTMGTVTITVVPPISNTLKYQVVPGGSLNVASPGVLSSTAAGQTAVLQNGPSNASSFNLSSDGSFTYTPNAGFSGIDTFTFENVANGTSSAPATVTIAVEPTISLAFSSPTVYSGNQVTGTVTVSPAPTSDLTVNLTSGNTAVATVDSSVTVPAGTTDASFTISAQTVKANSVVSINAQDGGIYFRKVLTVLPTTVTRLSTFNLANTSVQGGSVFHSLVGVTGFSGDSQTVSFLSGNSSAATAPSSASISAGAGTTDVAWTTSPVAVDQRVNVIAASSNARIQKSILVLAPRVQSLSFGGQTSVSSGNSATLTIILTGPAPTGGTTVILTGVLDGVSVISAVTIPAGQSFTTATETAPPIGEVAVLKVFAKGYAGSAAGTTITVTP